MSEEAKLKAKYGGALPRQQNMLRKKLMTKVRENFRSLIVPMREILFSPNTSIPEIITWPKRKVNYRRVNPIQVFD